MYFLLLLYVCLYWWVFPFIIFLFLVVAFPPSICCRAGMMVNSFCFCLSVSFWFIHQMWMRTLLGRVFLIIGFSLSSLSIFHINFYLYCYVCEKLWFLTLEKWPSVGGVLCSSSILPTHHPWPGTSWSQGRFWSVRDSVPQIVGLYFSCFEFLPPGGWG